MITPDPTTGLYNPQVIRQEIINIGRATGQVFNNDPHICQEICDLMYSRDQTGNIHVRSWLNPGDYEIDLFTEDPDEMLRMGEILVDPVKWIEWELGIVLYNWQAEILRDPAPRKLLRLARRSGKTFEMALDGLWFGATHPNAWVSYFTPEEEQAEEIYLTVIDDILPNSKHYRGKGGDSFVKGIRQRPFRITLNNGSRVEFGIYKQGKRGKGKGTSRIYMDELDYVDDEQKIVAIEVIVGGQHNITEPINIMCSSTPSGSRGKFFQYATNPSMGYKSWHRNIWQANPSWNLKRDLEERARLTYAQYMHEYLAEFGEEQAAVFAKHLLALMFDVCEENDDRLPHGLSEFDYQNQRWTLPIGTPGLLRTMGVDWDKEQSGPEIVVLQSHNGMVDDQMNQHAGFVVIYRESIPVTGSAGKKYAFTRTVNRILELDQVYQCNAIYVDRGYGEMQGETLTLKLGDKVRPVSYSERVTVHDTEGSRKASEPIKPLMVNCVVKMLEEHKIFASRYDVKLRQQMTNYRVKKYLSDGKPQYTDKDEHCVDALCLAAYAMYNEFYDVFKSVGPNEFHVIDNPLANSIEVARAEGVDLPENRVEIISVPWQRNLTKETNHYVYGSEERPVLTGPNTKLNRHRREGHRSGHLGGKFKRI